MNRTTENTEGNATESTEMKTTEFTEGTEAKGKYPYSDITERIIKCAIEVHKTLGPGFMESVYENAMIYEFNRLGLGYEKQKLIRIPYKDTFIGEHRIDLVVEDAVVVELKAIKAFEDVHKAQLLSYLKATGKKVGLLINFANTKIEIKRLIL